MLTIAVSVWLHSVIDHGRR